MTIQEINKQLSNKSLEGFNLSKEQAKTLLDSYTERHQNLKKLIVSEIDRLENKEAKRKSFF